MERGPFAAAPLDALFADVPEAEFAALRGAAARVDAARPRGDAPEWYWYRGHAERPEPPIARTPRILATTLGLTTGPRDWTEVDLEVRWTRRAREAAVELGVACWCDVDHNTHYVRCFSVAIGTGSTLAEAFAAAAQCAVDWSCGPAEPEYWRAWAGLPSPD